MGGFPLAYFSILMDLYELTENSRLKERLDNLDYYLFLCLSGPKSDVSSLFEENFGYLSRICEENNTLLVVSQEYNRLEFEEEVFQAYRLNGIFPDSGLIISKSNPIEIAEEVWCDRSIEGYERGAELAAKKETTYVSFKEFCKSNNQAQQLLQTIVAEVQSPTNFASFMRKIQKITNEDNVGEIALLKPNLFGFGVDLRQLANATMKIFK